MAEATRCVDGTRHIYEVQITRPRDEDGVDEYVIVCLGCGDCRTVRPA